MRVSFAQSLERLFIFRLQMSSSMAYYAKREQTNSQKRIKQPGGSRLLSNEEDEMRQVTGVSAKILRLFYEDHLDESFQGWISENKIRERLKPKFESPGADAGATEATEAKRLFDQWEKARLRDQREIPGALTRLAKPSGAGGHNPPLLMKGTNSSIGHYDGVALTPEGKVAIEKLFGGDDGAD